MEANSTDDRRWDDPGTPESRIAVLGASFRSGIGDLKRFPGLVSLVAVVVFIATLLALAGQFMSAASEVGEAHVTLHSEIVVLLDDGLDAAERLEVRRELATISGVADVRPPEPDDIEALPPGQALAYGEGTTLVIEPNGSVQVEAILFQAMQTPTVSGAALGVGVPSQRTMSLLTALVPWAAACFLASGLVLIGNLAFAVARTREEEASTMRLLGLDAFSIWLRSTLVVAVPALAVIGLTASLIVAIAPVAAATFVPDEAAASMDLGPLIRTGSFLLMGGIAATSLFGLAALARAARK